MNRSRFIGTLAFAFLAIWGCSDQPAEEPENLGEVASWEMPFMNIEFDPSLTTEEWLNVIISDSMNGELDLENYLEVFEEDAPTEIVFAASGENGLGIYQLLGNQNFEYTLSEVGKFSEIQLKRHDQIAGIDIYRIHEDDVNGDGMMELIVGADISGTAHNDEGMYPYRMIQFEVLSRGAEGYEVNRKLTEQFNEDLGVDLSGHTAESTLEVLSKKYHASFANTPDNEVQALMQGVLQDMEIATYRPDDLDREFSSVVRKDGSYVVDMAWLASGYYMVAYEDNDFNIERNSSWNYPILYITDREVETWQIFDIELTSDTAFFEFRNVDTEDGEISVGRFTQDENERWVFDFDGTLFMMGADSKDLEVIERNSDQ